jgi:alginate O-acetyltransferase complex protein AlgI
LVIGLFQKVILADTLMAPVADKVYSQAGVAGFIDAWIGTLAFSAQIFFDFSGYSNCAIGAALCLGFVLPDNFRFPYAAAGFSEFWRRWHISLSTWLRDYLYISLGGNRKGRGRTLINVMVTMLLGGLWHGASWRFIFWGGLHGIYLVIERGLRKTFKKASFFSTNRHAFSSCAGYLFFSLYHLGVFQGRGFCFGLCSDFDHVLSHGGKPG